MHSLLIAILLILGAELLAVFLFYLLAKWVGTEKHKNQINVRSIIKGVFERGFLTFALANTLPQALTVFAALKIATRIKGDEKITNDFYLLGNLLSIMMAVGCTKVIFYFNI